MVYDCFQFFNELDILLLRMRVMNDVVDKFVISESTVTFSGVKKPLYFQENQEMFAEFQDKIIHKVVDDSPMGSDTNAFMRDSHQKQAVATLYVISTILGLSAVVLTTSGEIKAMLLMVALCTVGLVASRVVFPKQSAGKREEPVENTENTDKSAE